MTNASRLTMQKGAAVGRQALVAACLTVAGWAASAAQVTYSVTDLPDTGAADLWQVDYTVTGPLASEDSLQILFDPAHYSGIEVVNTLDLLVGPLSVTAIGVDSVDPTVSGYVAVSSFAGLSAGDSVLVNVTFNWTGPHLPGVQPVQQFSGASAAPTLTFETIPSAVPEVSAAQLMLAGLAGVGAWVARRRPARAVVRGE